MLDTDRNCWREKCDTSNSHSLTPLQFATVHLRSELEDGESFITAKPDMGGGRRSSRVDEINVKYECAAQ